MNSHHTVQLGMITITIKGRGEETICLSTNNYSQIKILVSILFVSSVTLQPAPGDTGKPCGIDYEMKAFVGDTAEDKPHKR